jgi:uncharacterized protein YndB with AHSA1/START domain
VIDSDRVIHEIRYPHAVPDVWHALTDSDSLAVWLMPNDFAPVVGHRFRFDARPGFGFIDGEVLEVDPPRLLRCHWTVDGTLSTVTIQLEADGADTVLRLEHRGLAPQPRSEFDGGWGDKLRHDLGLVLAGSRDPTKPVLPSTGL